MTLHQEPTTWSGDQLDPKPAIRAKFQPPNPAARRLMRRLALVMVVTPPLGLAAAIVIGWGHGVAWVDVMLLTSMYIATVLGVEVGLHRHFSHRAFKAHWTVRSALAILGSMAAQGPVLFWVSVHRRHHEFSDQPGDPHSPHFDERGKPLAMRGLWHAHVGWLFRHDVTDLAAYAPDVLRDRLAFWLHRTYAIWVLCGLAIPAALGGLLTASWTGCLTGFLWGGLVRVFFVHHATWSVNSLCHTIGSRAHETHDHSTNNPWLVIPSLGGSWHNNHHAFPYAAHNSIEWWQVDPSGWVIDLLARLGLVWDVRTARDRSSRAETADGSKAEPNFVAQLREV